MQELRNPDITEINFLYNPNVAQFMPEVWKEVGNHVSLYVREALNTRAHPVSLAKGVHFRRIPYQEGDLGPRIFIKIRTFGYPDRISKVERTGSHLRDEIVSFLSDKGVRVEEDDTLIWVDYLDSSSRCI